MPDVRPPSRGIVPVQRLVPLRNTSPAATPATRSTEERASARPSFRHSCFSGRYSPRARSFSCLRSVSPHRHTLPGLTRRTPVLLAATHRPLAGSPCFLSALPASPPSGPSFRPFPHLGQSSHSRPASQSIDPEGFRSSQASRVRAVLVHHSHTLRRSNPGVQRTRFARR